MYQYKATQIEIHAGDGAVPEAFGFNQSRYHDVAFFGPDPLSVSEVKSSQELS